MEPMRMEDLVPLICEVINSGSEFRLYPRGKSMLPTIVEGRDSVMLALPGELKVMDAVLYRRVNGQYVLHRIVACHAASLDMCGDNQTAIEKNVPRSAVIAKVTGIFKGDRFIPADDPLLQKGLRKLYAKKPAQRFLHAVKRAVYPLYRRLFRRNKPNG